MILHAPTTDFSTRKVRLETLVGLRWLAVVGQTMAILVVHVGFGFQLPLLPCLVLIGASAALNLYLRASIKSPRRLDARWAAWLLAYDVLQLSGLLFLTGGLENPFAVLLLVPALVSASILPPRTTVLLCLLVLALATLLGLFHQPLPWRQGVPIEIPFLFVAGVWIALTSSLVFMAIYIWRVAEETRQLSDALAATELVLAREQHLSQLDGLAAAAAHELGTPLATITLAAKELGREMPAGDPHREDVVLIGEQTERCRDILAKIASLGTAEDDRAFARTQLTAILDNVIEPHRDFGIAIRLDRTANGLEPMAAPNPGVIYGLGNLIENAVDFAKSRVDIKATWDSDTVTVTIEDDGPGFAPDVIDKIGEPYVSTRPRQDSGTVRQGTNIESGGLGLGFFIAKTLLERSGARVSFGNRPSGGAMIELSWPRAAFDTIDNEAENPHDLKPSLT